MELLCCWCQHMILSSDGKNIFKIFSVLPAGLPLRKLSWVFGGWSLHNLGWGCRGWHHQYILWHMQFQPQCGVTCTSRPSAINDHFIFHLFLNDTNILSYSHQASCWWSCLFQPWSDILSCSWRSLIAFWSYSWRWRAQDGRNWFCGHEAFNIYISGVQVCLKCIHYWLIIFWVPQAHILNQNSSLIVGDKTPISLKDLQNN